ncbi:CPBP family intramembrane glutamic endopeptidase [Pleionea sediminis]|uniref:CPBP family intramembrane glutamic endopeptidase n=1 Tax=Pleionea sediminis TaxID=2569479 RepID=UPI001184C4A5|nr:CPBP family intramembrane glutamic endopeptidase [Pleionea sediminis]
MFHYRLSSPWNFKQGFLILISFILLYFGLSAAHMIWVKSTLGFEEYLKNDTDFYTKVLIFSQLTKAIAIAIAITFVGLKRYQLNWEVLGFRSTTRSWITIAILLAIAGFICRFLLMKWLSVEVPAWVKFMQPPLQDLNISSVTLFFFLILTVVITPVVEETFFRGFLFQWMTQKRPVWIAAVISSLMFGASHIVPPQAIAAVIMSFIFIFLFVASRSIWPPIIAHVINNALSIGGNMLASAQLLPEYLMPPVIS